MPFWGYARYRVEGAMVDYLRHQPLVHVTPKAFDDFKILRYAHDKFCNQQLREPDDGELAAETGFSVKKIHQIRQMDHQYEEPGPNLPNPEGGQSSTERIYVLMEECMKRLTRDEKKVFIRMHFHNDILVKLAKEMDVSHETIRRLKIKAVKKIKNCMIQKGIEITDG